MEGGLEDVGALHVLLFRLELAGGLDGESATVVGVEDRGEDGRGVESWETAPIDRAVAADERAGLEVADQAVVGERFVLTHSARGW